MSVELMPLSVTCPVHCEYCLQSPIRDAGNTNTIGKYDLPRMIEKGLTLGSPLTAYGGEATLLPEKDLEAIFKASHAKYGQASIQSNGHHLTDSLVEMSVKYKVGWGISIDGPGQLNSLRPMRSDGDWKTPTEAAMRNLVRLKEAGVAVSVISILHKQNGTPERLPLFKEWGLWLASIGINYVNVHPLETESWAIRLKHALPEDREIAAMLDLAEWLEGHPGLRWAPFHSVRDLQAFNSNNVDCTWLAGGCDPLTTSAVQAVLGDGSMTNCGRTAKEGITWVKTRQAGYERYISLYQTPQEYGGCKGCNFWLGCGGSCPGATLPNDYGVPDWRMRTANCGMMKALFGFYETQLTAKGEIPLSLHPARQKMEKTLLKLHEQGKRCPDLKTLMDIAVYGKSVSAGTGAAHGDAPHGDAPHGDSHGDSWETS